MAKRRTRTRAESLIKLITVKAGVKRVSTTERIVKAFLEVMLECLEKDKEFYIPKFGNFRLTFREAMTHRIKDYENGGTRVVYCPPKFSLEFTPANFLLRCINEGNFAILASNQKEKKFDNTKKLRYSRFRTEEEREAIDMKRIVAEMVDIAEERKQGKKNE